MSEQHEEHKSGVNWGGLGKNLLAGAAIVVGALIVFPGLGDSLSEGMQGIGKNLTDATNGSPAPQPPSMPQTPEFLKDAAGAVNNALGGYPEKAAGAVGDAGHWLADGARYLAHKSEEGTASGIGALITKAIGVVIAYLGVKSLTNNNKPSQSTESSPSPEERETHAMRLDMQKMQAVMAARMAASGHEPAMGMAGARGR